MFGVIAPLPADFFTLDEVLAYVYTWENRDSTADISAMRKEKRRAIESKAGGVNKGPLLGYHSRCRFER